MIDNETKPVNRAQRRALARFCRRSSRPRPHQDHRPEQVTMLARMQCVLAPLESIINQIEETGTVNTGPGGVPMFLPLNETTWCATVPAIIGITDLFEMWATRHNRKLDLTGLTQFAHRLEYDMPITQVEIDAARRVMSLLRRVVIGLMQDEADDLIRQVQIKDEFEATQKLQEASA